MAGKPRSAAQQASLKKAQEASARKRRAAAKSTGKSKDWTPSKLTPRGLSRTMTPKIAAGIQAKADAKKAAAKPVAKKKASVAKKTAATKSAAAKRAATKAQQQKETQAYLKNYSKLTREQDLKVSRQVDKTRRIQRAVQGWGTKELTAYDKKLMKRIGVKPGSKSIPLGGSKESNAISKRLYDAQQTQTRKRVARLAARNSKKKKR